MKILIFFIFIISILSCTSPKAPDNQISTKLPKTFPILKNANCSDTSNLLPRLIKYKMLIDRPVAEGYFIEDYVRTEFHDYIPTDSVILFRRFWISTFYFEEYTLCSQSYKKMLYRENKDFPQRKESLGGGGVFAYKNRFYYVGKSPNYIDGYINLRKFIEDDEDKFKGVW